MNEEHFLDPSPSTKSEREAAEGRLDLRTHHHPQSRYRLLNLRDCGVPKPSDEEELDVAE